MKIKKEGEKPDAPYEGECDRCGCEFETAGGRRGACEGSARTAGGRAGQGGEAVKRQHAYVVIDVNGRCLWTLCHQDKGIVSEWARHPCRKVARVEVVAIVRKSPKRRGKR